VSAIDHCASNGIAHLVFTQVRDQNIDPIPSEKGDQIADLLLNKWETQVINEKIGLDALLLKADEERGHFHQAKEQVVHAEVERKEIGVPVGITEADVVLQSEALDSLKSFFDLSKTHKFGLLVHDAIYPEFVKDFEILKVIKLIPNKRVSQNLPEIVHA